MPTTYNKDTDTKRLNCHPNLMRGTQWGVVESVANQGARALSGGAAATQ